MCRPGCSECRGANFVTQRDETGLRRFACSMPEQRAGCTPPSPLAREESSARYSVDGGEPVPLAEIAAGNPDLDSADLLAVGALAVGEAHGVDCGGGQVEVRRVS